MVQGPWYGVEARVYNPANMFAFSRIVQIVQDTAQGLKGRYVLGNGALSEFDFVVGRDHIENTSQLLPRPKEKDLRYTKLELQKLGGQFKHFIEGPEKDRIKVLGTDDLCTNEHLVLIDYILQRDIVDLKDSTKLVNPLLVHELTQVPLEKYESDEDREAGRVLQEKCKRIFARTLKSKSLVGFPVWGNAPRHWTLLVVRFCKDNKVEAKYYDSLSGDSQHKDCRARAEYLYNVLKDLDGFADFGWPQVLQAERSNHHHKQKDGTSCGLHSMYWWRYEVFQYLGCGGCQSYPTFGHQNQGELSRMRNRLNKVIDTLPNAKAEYDSTLDATIKVLETWKDKKPTAAKDKNAVAKAEYFKQYKANNDDTVQSFVAPDGKPCTLKELKALALEALAAIASDQLYKGLKPQYGCSKCRHFWGGCIYYKCNPYKCQEHMKQYPDKYGKDLKGLPVQEDPQYDILALDRKELIGGGDPVIPLCLQ